MPNELRPSEILQMFWQEQIVIEETARFLDPVYFDAVSLPSHRASWEVQS